MLELNLRAALNNKCISNPNKFLRECGLPVYTASRLLNNQLSVIELKYLELICIRLHCTVDDLLSWKPDKSIQVPKAHPLKKLIRKNTETVIFQKITNLSFEKIKELENFLDQINSEQEQGS